MSLYVQMYVYMCVTCSIEQVQQEGPLVALLHPDDLLGDVLTGRADPPHSQEDVVVEEVSS